MAPLTLHVFSLDGLTPLMLAAATERDATVEIFLRDDKVRKHINDADDNLDTALHHAYQGNNSKHERIYFANARNPSSIAAVVLERIPVFVLA